MKLVHFTDDASLVLQYKYPSQDEVYFKPQGLWVSDEEDYGWKQWCQDENFRLERLNHAYEVTLKKDANILYLQTSEGLQSFAKEYKYNLIPGLHSTLFINWPLIRKKYQGIVITPYQWSLRLEPGFTWYYSWDCASGCIWDITAIESIKPMNHETPALPILSSSTC